MTLRARLSELTPLRTRQLVRQRLWGIAHRLGSVLGKTVRERSAPGEHGGRSKPKSEARSDPPSDTKQKEPGPPQTPPPSGRNHPNPLFSAIQLASFKASFKTGQALLEKTWTIEPEQRVSYRFPHASQVETDLLYKTRETALLKNVTVLSDSSMAFSQQGHLFRETTRSPRKFEVALVHYRRKPFAERRERHLCTVLGVGRPWSNYFHFMVEVLNRTHALWHPEIQELGPIQVYLSIRNLNRDHVALTRALLPPNAKLVPSKNRLIEADRYLALPYVAPSGSGYLPPAALARLRKGASSTFKVPSPAAQDESILISRKSAKKRRILNEDELFEALRPRGFRRVALERLTLPQQVALFHRARAVVGPHGAGLTNLFFSQDNCQVLELFSGEPTKHYRDLCGGLVHHGVNVAYADLPGRPGIDKNSDFSVDIDAALAKLDALAAERPDASAPQS